MFSWLYFSKKNYLHQIRCENFFLYFFSDMICLLVSLIVSFLYCDPKYYQFLRSPYQEMNYKFYYFTS